MSHYQRALNIIDDCVSLIVKSKQQQQQQQRKKMSVLEPPKESSKEDDKAASASKRSLSRINLLKPDTIVSKICLLYAMGDESKPIIEHYSLTKNETLCQECYPSIVFSNTVESNNNNNNNVSKTEVFVILNGKDKKYNCDRVGTQAAAISAYNAIKHIKPNIMINAGTCGGIDIYSKDEIEEYNNTIVKEKKIDNDNNESKSEYFEYDYKIPSISIGQVYIGYLSLYCDRNIPFEPWIHWGIGFYELFGVKKLANYLNLPLANVTTGLFSICTVFCFFFIFMHFCVCVAFFCFVCCVFILFCCFYILFF